MIVAGFAGFGALGSKDDTEWAERATDLRETGERSDDDEDAVARRNKLAQEAPVGGRSDKLRALFKEHREELLSTREANKLARHEARPCHGNKTKFADNMLTPIELAALIFRVNEWMGDAVWPQQESEPPSDDEATELRHAQETAAASEAEGSGSMEESAASEQQQAQRKRHRDFREQ